MHKLLLLRFFVDFASRAHCELEDCSAAAFFVVTTLRNLSRDGRTIIASIHQPSSEVFELFDNLTLLSGGRLVYFGEASGAHEVWKLEIHNKVPKTSFVV